MGQQGASFNPTNSVVIAAGYLSARKHVRDAREKAG